MTSEDKILQFVNRYNFNVDKIDIYKLAFIHRSYNPKALNNNERLEFLGDAILEYIVTTYLYTNYPEYDEGKLSQIRSLVVSAKFLAIFAQQIGIDDILMLSKGEETNGGRRKISILSDTMESLIGAIYLCEGLDRTKEFCLTYIENSVKNLINSKELKDPKTKIQELSQKKFGVLPIYELVKEEKVNNEIYYVMYLKIKDLDFGPVRSNSKKEAKEMLAKMALQFFDGLI